MLSGTEDGEPRVLAAGCTRLEAPGLPSLSAPAPFAAVLGPAGGSIAVEEATQMLVRAPGFSGAAVDREEIVLTDGSASVSLSPGSHELTLA